MPAQFPGNDQPPGGGGVPPYPVYPAPPPPGAGGGSGGNPYAVTLRSSTPLYGRRYPAAYRGWGVPAPTQFQGAPMPNARPYSASPNGATAAYGPTTTANAAPMPVSVAPSGPAPGGAPSVAPNASRGGWLAPRNVDPNNPHLTSSRMIRDAEQAGAYSPYGSPAIHKALSDWLEQQGRNDIRKADLGAQLYGYEDPMGQQYVRQNAEQSVRDRIAEALSKGDLSSLLQNNGQLWQLLLNSVQAAQASKAAREARNAAGAGGWGQLAGAAVGALIP